MSVVVWVEGFLSAAFFFFLRSFSSHLGEREWGLRPACEAGRGWVGGSRAM